ncbi:hypothetical protein KIF24_26255 [Micromonospora sp. Llam7]|uniref:hypothetical protein n=1 Tax=Micromonospora tarapacensis TaxID=2835305 RepID=UPI001C83414A|nr:hypothetical protein [Micromonospora tarapacensis]MBX7269178.1 hypothetical protein [Micromonospora tarapacensis]
MDGQSELAQAPVTTSICAAQEAPASMDVMISLIIGIPIGVFQSILMLWIVFRVLTPRLVWSAPMAVTAGAGKGAPDLVATVSNVGRRDAVDVAFHADLRVDHDRTADGLTRSLVKLPLNSSWMPRLRRGGWRRIRIEDFRIPASEWKRLESRTGIVADTLADMLQGHPNAHVRLYGLASDPFSGSRQVFVSVDLYAGDFEPAEPPLDAS